MKGACELPPRTERRSIAAVRWSALDTHGLHPFKWHMRDDGTVGTFLRRADLMCTKGTIVPQNHRKTILVKSKVRLSEPTGVLWL